MLDLIKLPNIPDRLKGVFTALDRSRSDYCSVTIQLLFRLTPSPVSISDSKIVARACAQGYGTAFIFG